MPNRLFILDVPENTPITTTAKTLPHVTITKIGPYFAIESDTPLTINRRATGVRHAVWYSFIAGLDGWRITQWDKDTLTTEQR